MRILNNSQLREHKRISQMLQDADDQFKFEIEDYNRDVTYAYNKLLAASIRRNSAISAAKEFVEEVKHSVDATIDCQNGHNECDEIKSILDQVVLEQCRIPNLCDVIIPYSPTGVFDFRVIPAEYPYMSGVVSSVCDELEAIA